MHSLLITFVAGLFFLIGVYITFIFKKNQHIINFSLGMGFIVLILLVVIDIIPECIKLFSDYWLLYLGGGILGGLGILMLLDLLVPHHDHHELLANHQNHLVHLGVMTTLALVIHNIIEGIGIYGVASASLKTGIIYALGVGLHNIPFGIQITAFFNHKEAETKLWISITLLTFSTLIGGLLMFMLRGFITDFLLGFILSLTIGMIIYILIWELLIEIKETYNKYTFYGIVSGFILMLITMLI